MRSSYQQRYYDLNKERLKARSRSWYWNNLERAKASRKKYAQKNPDVAYLSNKRRRQFKGEEVRIAWRIWRRKNAVKVNFSKRRLRYGITPESYFTILKKQKYGCAICGRTVHANKFHVDHDHNTRIVRGLLCCGCNWGLGNFGENQVALKNAIKYLRQAKRLARTA